MSGRGRMTVVKAMAAKTAVAGAVAVGGLLVSSAQAAADQPPPDIVVDPAAVPPPESEAPPLNTIRSPLAQNGIPGGLAGIPDLSNSGNDWLLGQAPLPSVPGTAVGTPPSLSALNNNYLLGQNVTTAAPGQGTQFGVAPGDENADTTFIEYLMRLHASYQQGGLTGALLGQRPQEELGEPLPGPGPTPPPPDLAPIPPPPG